MEISYRFTFDNNENKEFRVVLDSTTLLMMSRTHQDAPPWTLLERHRCGNCPMDSAVVSHCPIAVNLADIVAEYRDSASIENVHVTVTTPQRTFAKTVSLQEGLGPLIGIVMVTSGCPVMEPLKPMVRFHLPFASMEETEYRMVSMYLVAQYYRHCDGKEADLELSGLKRVYEEVGQVNNAFAGRFREAAENDANINALINLDCYAKSVPFTVKKGIHRFRDDFRSYLEGVS
jgi:hypothetical protein